MNSWWRKWGNFNGFVPCYFSATRVHVVIRNGKAIFLACLPFHSYKWYMSEWGNRTQFPFPRMDIKRLRWNAISSTKCLQYPVSGYVLSRYVADIRRLYIYVVYNGNREFTYAYIRRRHFAGGRLLHIAHHLALHDGRSHRSQHGMLTLTIQSHLFRFDFWDIHSFILN